MWCVCNLWCDGLWFVFVCVRVCLLFDLKVFVCFVLLYCVTLYGLLFVCLCDVFCACVSVCSRTNNVFVCLCDLLCDVALFLFAVLV